DPPAAADRLPGAVPGWGFVTPFVLQAGTQFGPSGPPALSGPQWARDYNEVKDVGSLNSVIRTEDQEDIARFWYEPSTHGWSRIARIVAESQLLDTWQTARLLALAHAAMADGFISGFRTKYEFDFWRPVTAIRAGDTDGNDATIPDPAWSSLLNTPNLPEYASVHAVLGGAAADIMRRFFKHDDVPFTMTSGNPFPGRVRSYTSFSQAAEENGNSRIYAGIHFRTAVEDGLRQGDQIGGFVFTHILRPRE
ncbi:MAG TPA: vanadium-dependent haloperoxidase, partial [Terriglobia bacterium]|nr:vanadium-dependent haloperoxidase [Terriglobia bacterium]